MGIVIIAVVGGVVSVLSPFFWRSFLVRVGAFDVPNHRSSHNVRTLRGGGIGALTAFVVCIFIVGFGNPLWGIDLSGSMAVLSAAVLIGFVGFWEDLKGIPALIRALLQLSIGLMIAAYLYFYFDLQYFLIPLVALFFAANVNFTNFMDGINGISCVHALVAGCVYTCLGLFYSMSWLSAVGILTAVIFAGFLPWNLRPPHMFLGDVGSYLLGGMTATVTIAGVSAGISPVIMLSPLVIYWGDTVTTLFKRVLRRMPIFDAHRMHVYQRLVDNGFSHLGVAILVGVLTVLTVIASCSIVLGPIPPLTLMVAIVLLYLASPNLIKYYKRAMR